MADKIDTNVMWEATKRLLLEERNFSVSQLKKAKEEFDRIHAKIDAIQLKQGPAGVDADPMAVAAIIVEKHAAALRGSDGAPGTPGQPGAAGLPGRDGADADPEAVASVLVEKHADVLRGRDGVDADPEIVVKKLISDTEFLSRVKGDTGAPGADGAPGAPGAPGRDGSDGIGIKKVTVDPERKSLEIVLDDDQAVEVTLPEGPQGEPGAPGRDGVDGLGLETKAWEPGIYREGSFVTAEIGRVYKALRDTSAEPGKGDDWQRVGSAGFAWKGLKDASASYDNGDLYIDGGSAFIFWNGKGRMFAQRGAKGDQGPAGKDGKDGLTVVAIKADAGGFHLAMSDGSLMTAEVEGLDDYVDAVTTRKLMNFLEEQQSAEDLKFGTPIKRFRGVWFTSESYQVGDVVLAQKGTWLCVKPSKGELLADHWQRIAGGGGGGAGSMTNMLKNSGDVDLTRPLLDGAFLAYNLTTGKFEVYYVDTQAANPMVPGGAGEDWRVPSTANVQQFVDGLEQRIHRELVGISSGIRHQIGVLSIANAPGASPKPGDRYIVGTAPTGAFAGKANSVAEFISGAWVFQTPATGDAHYIDDRQMTGLWNGTAWVPMPRQERTYLQALQPTNPILGDCWLDNSGTKLMIKYWNGLAWISEAGTKTFTQDTDPSLVTTNAVKDGDVWVQTFPPVGTPPVAPTPQTQVRQGGAWTNTTPSIPASSRVYYQNTQPVGATLGDIWVDGSKSKLQVSYFDGTAWQNEAGTKTFTQPTDPALLANVVLQDGDVWVQTFSPAGTPPVTPTPVTKVRQGGGWTTTTPTVPASSRTFIQHTQPVGSVLGDQWIDLTGTKPAVQYFDGHAWVDSGGTRSFTSPTDPVLNPANTIQEGDIWTDNTDPAKPKIYQRTGGHWVQMNAGGTGWVPDAPPAMTLGVWSRFMHRNGDLHGSVYEDAATWKLWKAENVAGFCPVPAKYKTGSNWFKITVWFDTSMQTARITNAIQYVNYANGNWYGDKKNIPLLQTDRVTGSSTYFCRGDAAALQWMIACVTAETGITSGTLDLQIENVLVTWELLSIS